MLDATRVVTAAIVDRAAKRVLLVQRASDMVFPFALSTPGGKVRPGEDTYKALVRELREELGIALHGPVTYVYDWTGGVFVGERQSLHLTCYRANREQFMHEPMPFDGVAGLVWADERMLRTFAADGFLTVADESNVDAIVSALKGEENNG